MRRASRAFAPSGMTDTSSTLNEPWAEWIEIAGRPLTAQQTQRLAEHLVELETDKFRPFWNVQTWLGA